MPQAPDLRAFIVRSRVLKLYRDALKVAHRAPSNAAAELKAAIRREMEENMHCNDKLKIRFLLTEGLRRLKELDEMLDMQGHLT